MLIDWFTVIAQAANFLILVWLLKRFLYQPILDAVAAREQRIADELAAAAQDKEVAAAERVDYQQKNAHFERELETRQRKLAADIASERNQLMEQARSESEAVRATRLAQLEAEFRTLQDEVARRTQAEAFAIARHTLGELAGVALEAQMVEVFLQRLQAAQLPAQEGKVEVRSAFELDAAQRARIAAVLKQRYADAAQIAYVVAPELLGGIELRVGGHKLAWSIADRLDLLAQQVEALLRQQRRQQEV
ncbi:MAG: F0F1 ATP synthase subunit delta [Pseudomonadota bacterium]